MDIHLQFIHTDLLHMDNYTSPSLYPCRNNDTKYTMSTHRETNLDKGWPSLYFNVCYSLTGTKENGQSGSGGEEEDGSGTPPVPPRRKDKRRHNTPPRPQSNGLPPTPKVHMGACFSKVWFRF